MTLDRVTKRFADFTAVDSLSFDVPEGSIFGFLGPNGAGKTTSLRMVLDLLRPDSGSITIGGRPPGREALAGIGYLPEERGLYKRMSALELVAYFGALKGLSRAAARNEAATLLELVGLGAAAHRRIDMLSKGLAQKVQLATALLNRPKLLLLDEPFSRPRPGQSAGVGGDHHRAGARRRHRGVLDPCHAACRKAVPPSRADRARAQAVRRHARAGAPVPAPASAAHQPGRSLGPARRRRGRAGSGVRGLDALAADAAARRRTAGRARSLFRARPCAARFRPAGT
ncbi:MAG: ATP-binding cassette domain-containing protein [Aliidongia sp.]